MGSNDNNNRNAPIAEAREGSVTVAVFKNRGKDGEFYTIRANRFFKKGDGWQYSSSFSLRDKENLSKALGRAYDFIEQREQRQQQEKQQSATKRNTLSI